MGHENTGNAGRSAVEKLADEIERDLTGRWGPMLVGESLRLCLGYRTPGTFRQAIKSGKLPVPTFGISGRRGKHALTKDVARWIAERRASAGLPDDHLTSQEGGEQRRHRVRRGT